MKKNFKYKEMMLKKAGYKLIKDYDYPYFRKVVKANKYCDFRDIDSQIVNIITLEQLAKFLEVK